MLGVPLPSSFFRFLRPIELDSIAASVVLVGKGLLNTKPSLQQASTQSKVVHFQMTIVLSRLAFMRPTKFSFASTHRWIIIHYWMCWPVSRAEHVELHCASQNVNASSMFAYVLQRTR
eukprot:TRINITY_DN2703_c1_g1_i8.p1 TRINITY_DN2703_c1_g1~~TRINITY_DN2703_c1_g1_i8.p1  ORF type:complete len:125 (-),score=5.66 TRINITY_DN2703_c1_g1_i8:219-572(-)